MAKKPTRASKSASPTASPTAREKAAKKTATAGKKSAARTVKETKKAASGTSRQTRARKPASTAAKGSGAATGAKVTKKASKAAKKTTPPTAKKRGAPAGAAPLPGSISDEAVLRATGKSWEQWFEILDRFDAAAKGHRAAAIHVHERYGCPEWWSQMVVVAYEQGRGLREKHQTARGYQVGASKTIDAPVERAFDAFADPVARREWLPGVQLEIRKATRPKSLRITFVSGAGLAGYEKPTNVEVNLYTKGADKCQLQVQHDKLANAEDGERMKAYWREAMERLKERLEK